MRGFRAHYALTLIAAAVAAASGPLDARAQAISSYVDSDPNVIVDLSVLDGFGGPPNVADMLRGGFAGGAPVAATGGAAPAPAFLRRPDAPRYAAPPPEVQALIQQPQTARRPVVAVVQPPAAAPAARAPAAAPAPPPPPAIPPASSVPAPPPPPPSVDQTETAKAPAPASPQPAPKPAPEPPRQVASAPAAPPPAPAPAPADQGAAGDLVRIAFPSGQSQLPDAATGDLDGIVDRLKQDDSVRIQLLAYADGDQDGANKARRLSLSRALAVRAYLIDREVASTRMDVRALGNRADGGPPDRVDVVVIQR